jgi:septum formation protein
MPRLVLGSASPRRAVLLQRLGVDFDVRASDVTETVLAGEPAEAFVRRAAREKGAEVARASGGAWVLSADTIVVVDDAVLGKPVDPADARRMLQRLSGRTHAVLTAVALTAAGGELAAELLVRTVVEFRVLTEVEIGANIASGEPFDKAGAYAIQGGAAGFVARVEGSYTNVVGLPLDEVRDLLARHGLLSGARDRPVDRSS